MNMDQGDALNELIQQCNPQQGQCQPQEQDRQYQKENPIMDDVMNEKRKSEVMIAAQSLDNEVQSVKNLKRISIGSMDLLMDPELEYRVSSSAASRQGNRKSWTSGVPPRPSEEVSNTHNRTAVRYTYPSRAEPDESFENELSEISFELTNSEYLGSADSDSESSARETGNDSSGLGTNSGYQISSSGRRISGVGTLKRGASNIPSRRTSGCSDSSNNSNSSLTKNLLWVPANQHPNIKPENYLELVQDTLHNIKLEGDDSEEGSNRRGAEMTADTAEHEASKENEDHTNRPRKNSSLVRKPSRLRKSYTELDGENNSYQDTTDLSKRTSSEALENASSLTISPTNSSRTVSLRDITDELTKISNNAGLTDSDAVTLARTLSMAGSFTSDESDDILENGSEEQADSLQDNKDNESDNVEKKEDAEFASKMVMKNGFVIPARSSLRRSKFTTYRVKSPSEENLVENSPPDSELNDHSIPNDSSSSSHVGAAIAEPSQEENNSKFSHKRSIGPAGEVTREEPSRAAPVKRQDHLSTPGDQHSRGSKSPSQYIGDEGSNLTSPSTISDFQDIYDHYRQSSVDWEKELKKEHDLAQESENGGKPITTEVRIDSPALEESSDAVEASGAEVITKEDILLSTEISNMDDPIGLDNDLSLDNSIPQIREAQEDTVQQDTITREIRSEPIISEPHVSSCNRQVEKRGGWAFFNMGDRNILGEDQYNNKEEDTEKIGEAQLDEYDSQNNSQEGDDFIKTTTHMNTDLGRVAADRSNHSKNRHSPIFTENSKREIMEEPKVEETSSQARPNDVEASSDPDEPMNKNSDSESSNSFSAQKLEKKFVNLFKRKNKNKSSSARTSKTHKRLDLAKKTTNNTLPKFKKAVKNQVKSADISVDDGSAVVSSDGTSAEIALGQPVDDAIMMDAGGNSLQYPSEVIQEEPLSLQPAVSVQSTKSVPNVVVRSSKRKESNESRETMANTAGNIQNEAQQDLQSKRRDSRERRRERKQQEQEHQSQKRQQASNPPPIRNEPDHLPPRKLTFSDVKRLPRPNAPMKFSDSAFGFPLPMLTISTVIMFDHRLPINVERAIYRLSHLKLSDPKRELRQQVMLSNFMYAYLNLVNHTLYMEQVAQDRGQESQAASKGADSSSSADVTTDQGSSYKTDQNDANGTICIPDIQG